MPAPSFPLRALAAVVAAAVLAGCGAPLATTAPRVGERTTSLKRPKPVLAQPTWGAAPAAAPAGDAATPATRRVAMPTSFAPPADDDQPDEAVPAFSFAPPADDDQPDEVVPAFSFAPPADDDQPDVPVVAGAFAPPASGDEPDEAVVATSFDPALADGEDEPVVVGTFAPPPATAEDPDLPREVIVAEDGSAQGAED